MEYIPLITPILTVLGMIIAVVLWLSSIRHNMVTAKEFFDYKELKSKETADLKLYIQELQNKSQAEHAMFIKEEEFNKYKDKIEGKLDLLGEKMDGLRTLFLHVPTVQNPQQTKG